MTYIAEDGTGYKYRSEYWKTVYPINNIIFWDVQKGTNKILPIGKMAFQPN